MLNLMDQHGCKQLDADANFDAYCFDALVSFTPST